MGVPPDAVCKGCWGAVQIDRCFGFETAVEEAQRSLLAAKVCPHRLLHKQQMIGKSTQ